MDFSELTIEELISPEGFDCACGRHHKVGLKYVKVCSGATKYVPEALRRLNIHKPFIIMDVNTAAAAWDRVKRALDQAGVSYVPFMFRDGHMEPDEWAMGALAMAYDPSCDGIMGVGSGVINDCSKILARISGHPSMIVGTAPSMDGYASDSSSMIQNRIKVSLYNACPQAIIGDTDVLKNAPMRMLHAGLGDMLAKYTALCEWRIAHVVKGEYYCENIAKLVRKSLQKCVDNAEKLVNRDPEAVEAVMEGLILSGIAMSFAACSRPASGLDHYFSHMWEMQALDRGEKSELHGIQVGVGTLLDLKVFDKLKGMTPDWDKARRHIEEFDEKAWEEQCERLFGKAAGTIIRGEHEAWHKNDRAMVLEHIEKLQAHWPELMQIAREELPKARDIQALMQKIHMPALPEDLGLTYGDVKNALIGSRDIRDKYLISSILWEMGILNEFELQ